MQISGPAQALGSGSADSVPWLRQHGDPPETYPGNPNEEVLLWEDQPPPFPPGNGVGNQQVWEELSTRLTPANNFFFVSHYGHPVIDPTAWRLGIDGLVAAPRLAVPRRPEVTSTQKGGVHPRVLGQHRIPRLHRRRRQRRVGRRRASTDPEEARPLGSAAEVVFWGTDSGTVTIRDNPGILSPPPGHRAPGHRTPTTPPGGTSPSPSSSPAA